MNQQQLIHMLVPVGIGILIAWRLWYRVRRMVGRQKLSPRRAWVTVILFPAVLALLAFSVWMSRSHELESLYVSLAGGIAAGIALGVVGLRLTRFETTGEGIYYTPNAHLGIALSALLIARIGWRFLSGGFAIPVEGAPPPPPPALTPLTLLLIGTLGGYYTTYAVGLLRRSLGKGELPQTQSVP
jgi:hypothetical protein